MRTAFADTLLELARDDPRIMLVVGDLGFGVVMRFKEELPEQFVNAGVAEQNMTGLSAGLAMCGKIVFTYSIANFPVLRCLEQIRNDVCYHDVPVRIVTVGGGLAYGSLGPSHHATEDLAVLRSIPNLLVLAPGDPVETRAATIGLIDYPGPAYLRLGRAGEPVVHQGPIEFEFGRAIRVREGTDATLVSTGGMLHNCVEASEILKMQGYEVAVLSVHTLKPFDDAALAREASKTGAIFTVEEHTVIGGLGGATAESLLESGVTPAIFRRVGLRGGFSSIVGDQAYLWSRYGLDPHSIASTVSEALQSRGLREH